MSGWSVGPSCHLCSPPTSMYWYNQMVTESKHLQHIRTKHCRNYSPFKCSICSQTFAVELEFRKHSDLKHDGSSILPERNESKYLNSLGELMVRFNLNTSKGQENSAIGMLKLIKDMTRAKVSETREPQIAQNRPPPPLPSILKTPQNNIPKALACKLCGLKFQKLSQLREHQDSSHNLISNGPHKCTQCQMRFHYTKNLVAHRSSSHGSQELTCQFCVLRFDTVYKLRRHQDNRHNLVSDGLYKCNECKRRFHFLCVLTAHQRKAHAQKKFKRRNYKNRYQCSICQKGFSSTIGMHLATCHIKKPVVSCNKCNYKDFWRTGNAMKHIRQVHQGNAQLIDDRKSISAEIDRLAKIYVKNNSRRPLKNQLSLRAGQEEAGPSRAKPARKRATGHFAYCNKCNKLFNKNSVDGHLASSKHIGFHCLQCSLCGYSTFWCEGNMKRHIKQKHPGTNAGYVNNRHVIREEIAKLTRECIIFH